MMDTFGFDKFEKAVLDLVEKRYPEELDRELQKIGNRLATDVKLKTPVGTGELRRSIQVGDIIDKTIEVGTNKEYAPFVEYGHKTVDGGFVTGQHMFETSVEQLKEEIPSELESFYKHILRDFKL